MGFVKFPEGQGVLSCSFALYVPIHRYLMNLSRIIKNINIKIQIINKGIDKMNTESYNMINESNCINL